MPSRENRVLKLEEQVKKLIAEDDKRRFQMKAYTDALSKYAEQNRQLITLVQQLQPIILRLIGGYLILEKKGLFTHEEYVALTQKDADSFVTAACASSAKQMQNQSTGARPVENNTGDSGTGVSRTESVRESVPDSKVNEQSATGTIPDGLSGVRTSDGGNDQSTPVGEVAPSDRPIGSGK